MDAVDWLAIAIILLLYFLLLGVGQGGGSSVSRSTVKKNWLDAVMKEYPAWFNPFLNPDATPEERFDLKMQELEQALITHGADKGRALEVANHLIMQWPGGFLVRRADEALREAVGLGLLDAAFVPIENSPYINEEGRRYKEMIDVGGFDALVAYAKVMNAGSRRR